MIKILLADDNAVERTALKAILSSTISCEFIEVTDGQQALDLLCDRLRPQLCIFDLNMPRIGGLELIQRIRRDPELSDLNVMVSSASRDRDTILQLAKVRITGYLLKPYDAAKTIKVVGPVVESVLAAIPKVPSRNLLTKRLLLVDDDATSRTALKDILRGLGSFEIEECGDGQEAMSRLQTGAFPDAIFLDLHMPKIDGLSVLKRIRENTTLRQLRVIVSTGENDRERVRALAQLQISGYLLKPFEPAKVAATLQSLPELRLASATEAAAPTGA